MRAIDNSDFVRSMIEDANDNRERIGTEPSAIYEDLTDALRAGCETIALLSPGRVPGDQYEIHHVVHARFGEVPSARSGRVAAYHLSDGDYAATFADGLRRMIAKSGLDSHGKQSEPS